MNINNNRREVGPLQASAVGPVQTAAPNDLKSVPGGGVHSRRMSASAFVNGSTGLGVGLCGSGRLCGFGLCGFGFGVGVVDVSSTVGAVSITPAPLFATAVVVAVVVLCVLLPQPASASAATGMTRY